MKIILIISTKFALDGADAMRQSDDIEAILRRNLVKAVEMAFQFVQFVWLVHHRRNLLQCLTVLLIYTIGDCKDVLMCLWNTFVKPSNWVNPLSQFISYTHTSTSIPSSDIWSANQHVINGCSSFGILHKRSWHPSQTIGMTFCTSSRSFSFSFSRSGMHMSCHSSRR